MRPAPARVCFERTKLPFGEWSPEHVLSCAARQGQILESAALLLQSGGRLVYLHLHIFAGGKTRARSMRFLSAHPDFTLIESPRLYPHSSVGEGQFVAVLDRDGGAREDAAVLTQPEGGAHPRV